MNKWFFWPLCESPAPCSSWPGCWEPGPEFSWSTRVVWAGPAGAGDHLDLWTWRCQPCPPWCVVSWWQPELATETFWTSCRFLCSLQNLPDVQILFQVCGGEPGTRSKRTLEVLGDLLWSVFFGVSDHLSLVMKPWSTGNSRVNLFCFYGRINNTNCMTHHWTLLVNLWEIKIHFSAIKHH